MTLLVSVPIEQLGMIAVLCLLLPILLAWACGEFRAARRRAELAHIFKITPFPEYIANLRSHYGELWQH